jgi:SAM-dependent methyltransferase
VFRRDGVLYRQVNQRAAADYDALLASGLYERLLGEGLLISHEEVDIPPAADSAYRVIRPERVPFVAQPSEWCPGQLRAAALATLQIQRIALDHVMTLRDASAANIAFIRGRAVLFDTLSFGRLEEGRPWVAYRQFCQQFLAPLALACLVDVRLLSLLRSYVEGVPLDLASALLPPRTKMTPGLGLHIHAHARSSQRHADSSGDGARRASFSLQAFRGLVDNLSATTTKLRWEPPASAWRDYEADCPSYDADAHAAKVAIVESFLDLAKPTLVWDLGANTGRFSRLAAQRGADVVALEADPSAVEVAWQAAVGDEASVLPLVMDLSNPTSASGWASAERPSLAERGPADMVLALALLHHLAISNNVPLDQVVSWIAGLGSWSAIEWVPKDDPMVGRLLAAREDIFDDYREDAFAKACADSAEIVRREPVPGSGRVLYLLRHA